MLCFASRSLAFALFVVINLVSATSISLGILHQPLNSNGTVDAEASQVQAAILLAIQHIEDTSDGVFDAINDISFDVTYAPMNDSSLLAALSTATWLAEEASIDAILGPRTSEHIAASYAPFARYDIPQLLYGGDMKDFSSAMRDSHLMTIAPSQLAEAQALINLINKHFKWRQIVVFSSNQPKWRQNLNAFNLLAQDQGVDIVACLPFVDGNTRLQQMLKRAKNLKSKVFILLMDAPDAAEVLMEGYDMGIFKAGTQIIASGLLSTDHLLSILTATQPDNVHTIMKGFLTVKHRISLHWPAGQQFIAAWKRQEPTKIVNNDGSVWCSNLTDARGTYLYRVNGICTGGNYTSSAQDGSDIYESAALAYDAVLSLAMAVRYLRLKSLPSTRANIQQALQRLTIYGATGRITFASSDDTVEPGLRASGFVFDLLNYQYVENTWKFVTIGNWTLTNGVTSSTQYTMVHNSPNNESPIDTLRANLRDMHSVQTALLLGLAIVGMFMSGFVGTLLQVYRNTRLVKVSQPVALNYILLGCMFGFMRAVVETLTITEATCGVSMWFEHIAFALLVGGLAAKAWRVNVVMNSGMKRVRITRLHIASLLMIVVVIVVCLLVWVTITNPFEVEFIAVSSTGLTTIVEQKCSQSGTLLDMGAITLYIYQLALLCLGLYFAYLTRAIKTNIESSQRTASIFGILLIVYLGDIALEFGEARSPSSTRFIRTFLAVLAYWICFLTLFGGMTFSLIAGYDLNNNFEFRKKTNIATVVTEGQPRHDSSVVISSGNGNNSVSKGVVIAAPSDSGAAASSASSSTAAVAVAAGDNNHNSNKLQSVEMDSRAEPLQSHPE